MTIKEVSEKYEISQDTLRYYERVGMIPTVTRTAGRGCYNPCKITASEGAVRVSFGTKRKNQCNAGASEL